MRKGGGGGPPAVAPHKLPVHIVPPHLLFCLPIPARPLAGFLHPPAAFPPEFTEPLGKLRALFRATCLSGATGARGFEIRVWPQQGGVEAGGQVTARCTCLLFRSS